MPWKPRTKACKPYWVLILGTRADQKFIALAKTNYGFQKINEYLSQLQALKIDVPDEAPEIEDAFINLPPI